jgi:hypothetical protein
LPNYPDYTYIIGGEPDLSEGVAEVGISVFDAYENPLGVVTIVITAVEPE